MSIPWCAGAKVSEGDPRAPDEPDGGQEASRHKVTAVESPDVERDQERVEDEPGARFPPGRDLPARGRVRPGKKPDEAQWRAPGEAAGADRPEPGERQPRKDLFPPLRAAHFIHPVPEIRGMDPGDDAADGANREGAIDRPGGGGVRRWTHRAGRIRRQASPITQARRGDFLVA